LYFPLTLFVIFVGIAFGLAILSGFISIYANTQLPTTTSGKNNTGITSSNTTNSSQRGTNADLAPYLGYHYEYNFY
jgi:hypothetical protein